jgi:hypothetical protein
VWGGEREQRRLCVSVRKREEREKRSGQTEKNRTVSSSPLSLFVEQTVI